VKTAPQAPLLQTRGSSSLSVAPWMASMDGFYGLPVGIIHVVKFGEVFVGGVVGALGVLRVL
jgi:hypothetical protein